MSGFGRRMLDQWLLDPEITYLNHGTVGAPPRRVLAKQQAIRDEIERQPSQFLLRELTSIVVGVPRSEPPRLRAAAAEVAPFFGARSDDFAFVENATTGVNAVLRSLDLREGDEILVTDHVYGGVAKTAQFVARRRGVHVRSIDLPYSGPRRRVRRGSIRPSSPGRWIRDSAPSSTRPARGIRRRSSRRRRRSRSSATSESTPFARTTTGSPGKRLGFSAGGGGRS